MPSMYELHELARWERGCRSVVATREKLNFNEKGDVDLYEERGGRF